MCSVPSFPSVPISNVIYVVVVLLRLGGSQFTQTSATAVAGGRAGTERNCYLEKGKLIQLSVVFVWEWLCFYKIFS